MEFTAYQHLVFSQVRANGNACLKGAGLDKKLKKLGKSKLAFKMDCDSFGKRLQASHDFALAEGFAAEASGLMAKHLAAKNRFFAQRRAAPNGTVWAFEEDSADAHERMELETHARRLNTSASEAMVDTNDPELVAQIDQLNKARTAYIVKMFDCDKVLDFDEPIAKAQAAVARAQQLLEDCADGKPFLLHDRPGARREYDRWDKIINERDTRKPRQIVSERRAVLSKAEKNLSVLIDKRAQLHDLHAGRDDLGLQIEKATHLRNCIEVMEWYE